MFYWHIIKQCYQIVESVQNTENVSPRVSKTSNGIITFLVFVVCNINRYWFSKEQESRGLFSQLAIRTFLLKYHHWVIFCFRVIL